MENKNGVEPSVNYVTFFKKKKEEFMKLVKLLTYKLKMIQDMTDIFNKHLSVCFADKIEKLQFMSKCMRYKMNISISFIKVFNILKISF